MKNFVFSVIILSVITAAVTFNSYFVSKEADRILEKTEEMPEIPCEEAYICAAEIEQSAQSKEFLICLSVGHHETEDIFAALNELKVRSSGSGNDYKLSLEALRDKVEDLKKSESFSLTRIL